MSKGALRAVGDDERPAEPKAEIKSVLDAAEHGTRMDELVQMRLVIARAIDDPATSARDLAALSRRQIEISREVEALERQSSEEAEDSAEAADESFNEAAI